MRNPAYDILRRGRIVLFSIALLFPAAFPGRAQQARIDSLQNVLSRSEADTNRVDALAALAEILIVRDPRRAMELALGAEELAQKLKFRKGSARACIAVGRLFLLRKEYSDAGKYFKHALEYFEEIGDMAGCADALTDIAVVYSRQGRYEQALDYYQRSLDIREGLADKSGVAVLLGSIGNIHTLHGRNEQALEYCQRSLKIREELGDRAGIADALLSIGKIHYSQGRGEQALDYCERSLKILEELGEKSAIARTLNNIGVIHEAQNRDGQALDHYQRSLRIQEELDNRTGIASALNNIGNIHDRQGRFDQALDYYLRSLKIQEELDNKTGIASALNNIGNIHDRQGRFDQAHDFYRRSLNIRQELGEKLEIAKSLYNIGRTYSNQRRFEEAYGCLLRFTALRDSLLDETNLRTVSEMNAKYESERKDNEINLLEKDKTLAELVLHRQRDSLALQQLELARSEEQLTIQSLTAIRFRQQAALLARDREIGKLDLDRRTAERDAQQAEAEAKGRQVHALVREREYQSSIAARDRNLRNALLAGVGLLVVVGFLGAKRIQHKRTEAALRAEAAEYRARASEAHALSIAMDAEQHEKRMQQEFSRELLASQELERSRIAGDLHDSVGQELLVVRNLLSFALRDGSMSEDARERVETASEAAVALLDDVRKISRDLRPVHLDELGLTATLEELLGRTAGLVPFILEYRLDPIDDLLPRDREINVFRIVQEGLNNIVKHAAARRATVTMTRGGENISMSISDDGRGFAMGEQRVRWGLGLKGMTERVSILGGTMHLVSHPGEGTRIEITLPIEHEIHAE